MNLEKNKTLKYDKAIGFTLFFIAGITYTYFALIANLDLSEGKHVLFMDEQIVYRGVDQILTSNSYSTFLENIAYKGDHRYGKILYNATSLFSAIPEYIWGETGQIISTRLVQTLFLLVSYFIFCISFLRSWSLRAILFFMLLALPSTSYYFTMPKPEPIQLLFISLFFFYSIKNQFKFGNHWFFLGMALGAKISAFPIIAFYLLLSLYQERKLLKEVSLLAKKIFKSLAAIVIGWVIAEPAVLFGNWQVYLNSTWKNTSHGLDDSSVTVLSWLELIVSESSVLILTILIVGLLFCVVQLIYLAVKLLKDKQIFSSAIFKDRTYLVLILGFSFLLFYMLKVDRLWNFYLHIPFIFITIGVMVFTEKIFLNLRHKYKKATSITLIVSLPLFAFLLINAIDTNRKEYMILATRTSKPSHINKSAEFEYLNKTLKDLSIKSNKTLKVYYDPQLYVLSPNQYFEPEKFLGYFLKWEDQYDVVVFYPKHGENLKDAELPETNVRYDSWKKAIVLFDEFISNDEDSFKFTLGNTTGNDKPKSHNWVTQGDWKYSEGVLSKTTPNRIDIRQSKIGLLNDKTYQLEYTLTAYTSGTLFCKFGGGAPISLNDVSLGKHSITIVNDGTLDNFQFKGTFIGEIQNISLREISNSELKNNLLDKSEDTSKIRTYIKLLDDTTPKSFSVYLKSDIYNNYKNKK